MTASYRPHPKSKPHQSASDELSPRDGLHSAHCMPNDFGALSDPDGLIAPPFVIRRRLEAQLMPAKR